MNNIVGFGIFFAALFQVNVGINTAVKVTVLYESLCPDSMRFIRKQLYPTYMELKSFMDVELVPFGKAHYWTDPWRISCQHGPYECTGNALQACALDRYLDNEMQVKFINCVMSERFPPGAGSKCAKELNYNYEGIEECSKSEESRQLLSKLGDRTLEVKNNLNFVPTIIFNDVFEEQEQRMALSNLKSVVCRKIGEPIPEKCR